MHLPGANELDIYIYCILFCHFYISNWNVYSDQQLGDRVCWSGLSIILTILAGLLCNKI